MVGGTLMSIMGGIYYWFPKCSADCNEFFARLSFVFIFIGFNVTFFPQFIMGAMGMPRRYFDYLPEYTSMHRISTVGADIIGVGFFDRPRGDHPRHDWGQKGADESLGAKTLEWQTSSRRRTKTFTINP